MQCLPSSLRSLLGLFFSLMLACVSHAQETPAGIITSVEGRAVVIHADNRKEEARSGLALFPGDAIETETEAVVSFELNAGDTFTLNADSQVTLDELTAADDNPPVLRLALGFLWSRIKPVISASEREVIHTPTAIIGIRGTEFDTVVAVDASSAVAVDSGSVAVAVQAASAIVSQGQFTLVDRDEKIQAPTKALPREQRDWQQFRQRRARWLLDNLAQQTTRMRQRFGEGVERYLPLTRRIDAQTDAIDAEIKAFYRAQRDKKPQAARRHLIKIKTRQQKFRPMVLKFRKALNRFRVVGKHFSHLNRFFDRRRDSFSPADIAVIVPNLAAVSQQYRQMRAASRKTVAKIKRTYGELKKLRQLIDRKKTS